MGIVTKLQLILSIKSLIKNAIEKKGVEIGNSAFDQYPNKILQIDDYKDYAYTEADVRFIDYDGKELITMTKTELLALEELPNYPASHDNLKFKEWNWTLALAKSYVTKYGCALIGATLTSTDGSSILIVDLNNNEILNFRICFSQSVSEGVLIDWGDGNTLRISGTGLKTVSHTYSSQGKYIIKETPNTGCVLLACVGSYANPCGYAFESYSKALGATILHFIYGTSSTGTYAGFFGPNVKTIVFPQSSYPFLGGSFSSLKSLVLPNVSLVSNTGTLQMTLATQISIPHSITTISASEFRYCYKCHEIIIPDSVTSMGNYAFDNCLRATRIVVPESLTTISVNAFYACNMCKELILSEGLTSIGANAFYNCSRIRVITIPSTVTSIGNNAFYTAPTNSNALKLTEVHIKPTTPPTLGTSAFPNTAALMALYKIYVPAASVDTYKAATNWSAFSSIIEAEPTT